MASRAEAHCIAVRPRIGRRRQRGGRREGKAGLDLNAVLLDFGFRFVFRFGRKVQEKRQKKTKNTRKTLDPSRDANLRRGRGESYIQNQGPT